MANPQQYDQCIIIHGCPPNSDNIIPKSDRWMNWLEDKLNELGYSAAAPDMPTPWQPKYEEWKQILERYPITGNSLLVGHSCGGAFLVRWLLETGKTVKKLILVAPAKVPEGDDDTRAPMYDYELKAPDLPIADEIVLFTSNDFDHHLKSRKMYIEALHPRVIELPDKGHFLIFTMGTPEFPELLEEISDPQTS